VTLALVNLTLEERARASRAATVPNSGPNGYVWPPYRAENTGKSDYSVYLIVTTQSVMLPIIAYQAALSLSRTLFTIF
jgi:hypothetical protein